MIKNIMNGYNNYPITIYEWNQVDNPIGVVQIAHGMAEHLLRYDEFALFLNSNGYIVVGDDHRCHGETCGLDNLGNAPEGDCYWDTVEDMYMLNQLAKDKYNLPVILFGHSYGSFLSQGYITKYSDSIVACILCGSAMQSGGAVQIGSLLAKIGYKCKGKDAPAELLKTISFGGYDAKFAEKTEFAWGNSLSEEREKYLADPKCNFTLSYNFYKGFFGALTKIYDKVMLEKIRKDLPIFIISGEEDPVGGMGKLVVKLFSMYKKLGIENVAIKLYKGARHEILNEKNKFEVFDDVIGFIKSINN